MACTIHDLPTEILVGVLYQLDSQSLKKARLTSRRWGQAGAGALFHRIYFAPLKETMDLFRIIISEPAFAAGVTELVYDTKLFWEGLTDLHTHTVVHERFDRQCEDVESDEGDDTDDEDYVDEDYVDESSQIEVEEILEEAQEHHYAAKLSHQQYTELFARQKEILDNGLDFELLCQGLKKLPGLKTVSILDTPERQFDFIKPCGTFTDWYNEWSSAIWESAFLFPPTSWIGWCHMLDEYLGAENDTVQEMVANQPWDWRGVANCLRAISLHSPDLVHLHFGTETPLYILNDASICSSLGVIARNLRCLHWKSISMTDGPAGLDLTASSNAVSAMSKILHKAQQLRKLSTSIRLYQSVWQRTFGNTSWPYLSTLELGNMALNLAALKGICQQHEDTLLSLTLENIRLERTEGGKTWKGVGRVLGDILRLRSLTLASLCTRDYLGISDMLRVGYLLMRSRSHQKLDIDDSRDPGNCWVVMKYK